MSDRCGTLCVSNASESFLNEALWPIAILVALVALGLLIYNLTKQPEVAEAKPKENPRLKYLRKHGVTLWNTMRDRRADAERNFRPNFADVDFTSEKKQRRSRIWGKPVDLVGAERVVLTGINFSCAILKGCQLGPAHDAPRSQPGADLRHAKLYRADFSANLSSDPAANQSAKATNLRRVNFHRAVLSEADLRGADARGADFSRAVLMNANLIDARLDGANFAWADLTGAVISTDGLKHSNLFGAKLAHARIDGMDPRWLFWGRHLLGRRVLLKRPPLAISSNS